MNECNKCKREDLLRKLQDATFTLIQAKGLLDMFVCHTQEPQEKPPCPECDYVGKKTCPHPPCRFRYPQFSTKPQEKCFVCNTPIPCRHTQLPTEPCLPAGKQEEWERRVCTCNRQSLSNDSHFLNCPVLTIRQLIQREREAAVEDALGKATIHWSKKKDEWQIEAAREAVEKVKKFIWGAGFNFSTTHPKEFLDGLMGYLNSLTPKEK